MRSPAECTSGTIRRCDVHGLVLENDCYLNVCVLVRLALIGQALGLKAKPDVGDNGVHGSASPFEALAERYRVGGS